MTPTRAYRTFAWSFLFLGLGVLAVSYAVICARTGSLWPWNRVVHEDGLRTLLATVLYFEHGARELLPDIILGAALGGSLLFACPPADSGGVQAETRGPKVWGAALVTLVTVAVILVGAAFDVGLAALRDNLLQYHTRPLAPLEWGSHWRYHLLSRLALILSCLGIAGFLRLFIATEPGRAARNGLAVFAYSLLAFAAFTVVFSKGLRPFILPVIDPVYLGHQAREFFTHVLTTLPIAWGVCLLIVRPAVPVLPTREGRLYAWPITAVAGTLGAGLGLYVCLAAVAKDSASQGQTGDLAMLIFPHFFEHTQTYVVVPAIALLVYRTTWKLRRSR